MTSLSNYISYISRFTLDSCQFEGEALDGLAIRQTDMSDTKFDEIVYEETIFSRQVYLKLAKTVSNTVSWYMLQSKHVEKCTKNDYEYSLGEPSIFSLSIRYKDTSSIKIHLSEVKCQFKP